jgi:tetratricopeptide (TPR) repeat protein
MASNCSRKSKPASPSPLAAINNRSFTGALALILITILVYIPAILGGFIWDDDSYVQHNPALRSFVGLWNIWTRTSATPQYYPLVHTTFWIEYHLWGAGPGAAIGYKIINVLLHATSVILLWRLLRFLQLPGAWLAAAIFAVHPLNVESVAWITERKNVLSGVFYLLAFRTYLKAIGENGEWKIEDGKNSTAPSSILHLPSSRSYLVAFLFLLLALFSKTVTATMPAAMLLVLWWKRGRLRIVDFIRLLPFFFAGIVMGAVTGYLEGTQVGAHGPEWSVLTPIDRVLIAGRAICFYAGKLFLPINLSFIYPRWDVDPHQIWQFAYPIGVVSVVFTLWIMRRRIGRGPLTAVLFFIGTLFPALGFANVYPMRYSFVADHFQYLAGVGLICLFAALVASSKWRLAMSAIAIIALSSLTFARGLVYQDRETLWRDTLSKNPHSWMAHTNLGHALHAKGDDAGAAVQYQAALQDAPNVADTHLNAAIGRAISGDFDGAIAECHRAIEINPSFVEAYANMAKAYLSKGNLPEAQNAAREAIEIAPKYPLGHYMLARVLELSGQLPQAAVEYTIALENNPDDAEAHFHLANTLVQLRQGQSAIEHYQAALAIDPHNKFAWVSLGDLLLATGQIQNAAHCFQEALRIDPTLIPARVGLQRAGS